VHAGAPVERVQALAAGAATPLVDPADARSRQRNARVEVVFVDGG
jgi:flagellar motor protein MotB